VTKQAKSRIVEVLLPSDPKPEFKQLGGSDFDAFNLTLADQTVGALWLGDADDKQRRKQSVAACAALIGAKPQNELEGMLVSQMIACHAASLECHRRAMLAEQTIEGRRVNLSAASKMSRSYAALLEALNRHRGKGQQVVRVEHVTIQAGGQAIVGAVTQGAGGHQESEDRAHATPALAHAPESAMQRPDAPRAPVLLAGGEGPEAMPHARRSRGQRRTGR
jgi:hypothetical protein